MKRTLFLLLISFLLTSFKPSLEPHEGYVDVRGGRIWYKVIGTGPGTPIIVVHGGPGGRSCGYLNAFSLMDTERPIIFFDQLESGMSDRPNDTTLWKLPYFVEQLELLQKSLKLKSFHLLGSSWGAAIVMEYLLTKNTGEVESAIFSGPLLSTPQWISDAETLLSRLSQATQDSIQKYEILKDYNAPAYLAATDTFYANYMSRTQGTNKGLKYNCNDVPPFNVNIYEYMWGPTEFTANGTLKDFDRIDQLPLLKLPVLFIAGEYDEVLPETISMFQSKVSDSKAVIVPSAGHAKTRDNPEFFIRAVSHFILEVESSR